MLSITRNASASFVLLMIASSSWAADAYVCEKNGRKEFSQLPCGDNAVMMKTEDDASMIKISVPITEEEITALCRLMMKAKDRELQTRKTQSRSRRYNYNYDYNSRSFAQKYVLSHIANLEQLAKQSPSLYQLIKQVSSSVYYQGYDESPMYEAERVAALSGCEDNITQMINYN